MLQSLPPLSGDRAGEPVAQAAGFSLHAGVAAAAHQRNKLERLCRYITRPPVAVERLSLTPQGNVRVTDLTQGSIVWTPSGDGSRIAAPVVQVGIMPVPSSHLMVHLRLADGRELLASPGHRTANGRPLGSLVLGCTLDGSTVTLWELVPYAGGRTYDLLPAGPIGTYWANGVQLSSTLAPQ